MTIALACPSCGNRESSVSDSRPTDFSIRRRRRCKGCGFRFTTYETPEATNGSNMLNLSGLPHHVCVAIRVLARGART